MNLQIQRFSMKSFSVFLWPHQHLWVSYNVKRISETATEHIVCLRTCMRVGVCGCVRERVYTGLPVLVKYTVWLTSMPSGPPRVNCPSWLSLRSAINRVKFKSCWKDRPRHYHSPDTRKKAVTPRTFWSHPNLLPPFPAQFILWRRTSNCLWSFFFQLWPRQTRVVASNC